MRSVNTVERAADVAAEHAEAEYQDARDDESGDQNELGMRAGDTCEVMRHVR